MARNGLSGTTPDAPVATATAPLPELDAVTGVGIGPWVDPDEMDAFMPAALQSLNEMTPRIVMASAQ